MVQTIPTILAIGAVVLMGLAVVAMYLGELMGAGLSFLSASLVIYLRERRVRNTAQGA
ncbi:MAG: hypothetical protein ACI8XM_001416 [Haloarculaceae archaeon]|jgi:hypothetical protein